MLPLPQRGKTWKRQNQFQRTRQFLALLVWGREPIHHVPHTGGTLYILKGSRDLRSPEFGFDNGTPVVSESRIPTVKRAEGSRIKNEIHQILPQFSLILMQTFRHDQGQHSFYLSYQHSLKNQYCLQSYSCFSTVLRELPTATIHEALWQPHSQSHSLSLLGLSPLHRVAPVTWQIPAVLPAFPLSQTSSIPGIP